MEGLREIKISDKEYPSLLKKIKSAPKKLFVLGELKGDEKFFAIVGSRIPTDYGKAAASFFAKELARAGLCIVSGFAPGIDTIAHKSCLEVGGKTVAVLGTGLDEKSIYPRSNLKLKKEILEKKGALLSEYPPGTRGTKFTFPQRNRIVAGMSLGVLVVEAKEKSGALITAAHAFSFKRKVFAVPGSIFSKNSRGTHSLIKKGAQLVESPEEILQQLNIAPKKEPLSEDNFLLQILDSGPLSLEEIVAKSKLSVSQVLQTLTLLELEGKVKNLGKNVYCRS